MGYTTTFKGGFEISPPLTPEHLKYLREFADTRHENGDTPGYYCQWAPTDSGDGLVWDEGEKFYRYLEWLEYLIKKFFIPYGYTVNGMVYWQGEDCGDMGALEVKDNKVSVKPLGSENPQQSPSVQRFSSEGYDIVIQDGKATVSPKGETLAAIQLGRIILQGDCILEAGNGRKGKVVANYDYNGNLTSIGFVHIR